MTHPTRLGAPGDLCFAPMVRPLGRDERFSLLTDTSGANAVRLRERALDAALIGMIEYARDSSDWRILPGAAAAGTIAGATSNSSARRIRASTISVACAGCTARVRMVCSPARK